MITTIRPETLEVVRPRCPICHTGTIELVTDGEIGVRMIPGRMLPGRETYTRRERRPFGACNACEFCIEIDTRDLKGAA